MQVQAIQNYRDLQLNCNVNAGELLEVTEERAKQLVKADVAVEVPEDAQPPAQENNNGNPNLTTQEKTDMLAENENSSAKKGSAPRKKGDTNGSNQST